MSAQESVKEVLDAGAEVLATSLIQAPGSHTTAWTALGAGAFTGSFWIQVLAGIASVMLIYKTWLDIRISRNKLKKEKEL